MSISNMVQNRSKPSSIVHAFGSNLGHFDQFRKHVVWTLNLTETRSNHLQSVFKGILSKTQEQNENFQNGPKLIKTKSVVHAFGSNLGHFDQFQKHVVWTLNLTETRSISLRVFSVVFKAKYNKKRSISKMVQNRSKPWSTVHTFRCNFGHFDQNKKHVVWTLNLTETRSNLFQSVF